MNIIEKSNYVSEKVFIKTTATSTTNAGAFIGNYTSSWHYSCVGKKDMIGENCIPGENAYIGNNAVIGNVSCLGNSVSIFSHVELEDSVFCAPVMVFTHIGYPRAVINRHSFFLKK